jgi:hypothetical protein
MKYAAYTTVFTALMSMPLYADEFTPAMQSYFEQEIAAWANDGILIDAIMSQNTTTTAFDQSEIDALDTAWRNEVGHADTPTISPIISNAAAEYLRERVAASGGRITEIFVMDARGLNVAASDVTSDYWQGDESKFTETHGIGSGAVHISDVELDESTQRYQGQISLTITDPASGQPIGAMTVGVDAEALM